MPRPKIFGKKEPGRVAAEMERKFGIPNPLVQTVVPAEVPKKNGKKKAKAKKNAA